MSEGRLRKSTSIKLEVLIDDAKEVQIWGKADAGQSTADVGHSGESRRPD